MLQAVHLSKKINQNEIVKNINLYVREGSIHVIQGKSGSGKTTLLSMLGGMQEPSSGSVKWNQRSLYSLDDKEQAKVRANEFGFVFQNFQLLEELSAKQNILLPYAIQRKNEVIENFNQLTQFLEIDHLVNNSVHLLSGGERQRVAIVRALITQPKVVFADEPTGQLDEYSTAKLIELLIRLNQQLNVSLVIVTHQKGLIPIPHNKYTMKNGQIVERSEID